MSQRRSRVVKPNPSSPSSTTSFSSKNKTSSSADPPRRPLHDSPLDVRPSRNNESGSTADIEPITSHHLMLSATDSTHAYSSASDLSSSPVTLHGNKKSGGTFELALEEDGGKYDDITEGENSATGEKEKETLPAMENSSTLKSEKRSKWVMLAVASGACAAFNGVFAKLTTSEFTTSLSTSLSTLLGLSPSPLLELTFRILFFSLNLVFNGVMWTLFTKALKSGTSTTQVSILNTSSNFMITALLGLAIFSEDLPPLWWIGAGMLVAGSVIIGAREETDEATGGRGGGAGGIGDGPDPKGGDAEGYKDNFELEDGLGENDLDKKAADKRLADLDREDLLDFDESLES